MPLGNRYFFWRGGDPFPESLHVIDLLFDGEIVKTRRRVGDDLGHIEDSLIASIAET